MDRPWAPDLAMWYRSADTIFRQLSVDHNTDVQDQVVGYHTS